MSSPRTAAARKIQAIFRKRRANTSLGFKIYKPTVVSTISVLNIPIHFPYIFDSTPSGFTEVAGYINFRAKPRVRYTKATGWIGAGYDQVKYVTAKYKNTTVIFKYDQMQVSGPGNYEEIYKLCIRNKWILPMAMRMKPIFKNINCKFKINKSLDLPVLLNYFNHQIPEEMLAETPKKIVPELRTPALTVKFKKPKFTYQFFKNGTILFSGIKKITDIDVPVELFKQFFTKYGFDQSDVFGSSATVKTKEMNPSAGTWSKLISPVPRGWYIRPGTDGEPRLYPYQYYRKLNYGPNILNATVNLAPLAPKVVKAFEAVGKPIPESTLRIFRNSGNPLNVQKNKKVYAGVANRRATNWNSTKPGFYIRPGVGKQPYWYAIPKDLKSGAKTVIASYAKAGRNIPKTVREIFKIANNVKINAGSKKHEFMMGSNGILRINGRQATRITKSELLDIARNLKIAEVTPKMKPANIVAYIKTRTEPKTAGAYNVTVNGIQYKFLGNNRVRRLKPGKHSTTREWSSIKPAEKKALVEAANIGNVSANKQYSKIYQRYHGSPSSANLENIFNNVWN